MLRNVNVDKLLDTEGIGKNLKKKNILKKTGISLVLGAVLLGTGIKVADDSFDHTEGFCPIEQYFNIADSDYRFMGIEHQVKKMEEDYAKIGMAVNCVYEPCYINKTVERVEASKDKVVPEGYALIELDDKYYGERYVFEIFDAIAVYDNEGNLIKRVRIPQEADLDYLNKKTKKLEPCALEVVEGGSIEELDHGNVITLELKREVKNKKE